MIDNFDKIRSLLDFKSDDDFYFLQILQRKKDHNNGKVNGSNNNSRLIKAYYIHSLEYFDFIKPEVIELCNVFTARAGINLNKRSYEKLAFQTLQKVTDQIMNRDYIHVNKAYNSVCGQYAHGDKSWIIDIDDKKQPDREINNMILFAERECQPEGKKFVTIIPSKNGFHIIMKPFNVQQFKEKYPEIELHKNNPTNLYIP